MTLSINGKTYEAGELIAYVKSLEKENAELKKRVENQKSFLKVIKAKFMLGKLEIKEIEGYLESEQLIKAKELLKDTLRYLDLSDCVNNDPRLILYKSIEQFLSEVEK